MRQPLFFVGKIYFFPAQQGVTSPVLSLAGATSPFVAVHSAAEGHFEQSMLTVVVVFASLLHVSAVDPQMSHFPSLFLSTKVHSVLECFFCFPVV